MSLAAPGADARDEHAVAVDLEVVLPCDRVAELFQADPELLRGELIFNHARGRDSLSQGVDSRLNVLDAFLLTCFIVFNRFILGLAVADRQRNQAKKGEQKHNSAPFHP